MPAKRSLSKEVTRLAGRWRRLRAAEMVLAVGAVLVIVFLYVNLASSERKVAHPLPHRYTATDSQFVRAMGSLLGPGFVPGNQVTAQRGVPSIDIRGDRAASVVGNITSGEIRDNAVPQQPTPLANFNVMNV